MTPRTAVALCLALGIYALAYWHGRTSTRSDLTCDACNTHRNAGALSEAAELRTLIPLTERSMVDCLLKKKATRTKLRDRLMACIKIEGAAEGRRLWTPAEEATAEEATAEEATLSSVAQAAAAAAAAAAATTTTEAAATTAEAAAASRAAATAEAMAIVALPPPPPEHAPLPSVTPSVSPSLSSSSHLSAAGALLISRLAAARTNEALFTLSSPEPGAGKLSSLVSSLISE